MRKLLPLLFAIIACHLSYAQNIYTFAGGNWPGVGLGDGGPCFNARIYDPFGLATDTSGNLFIADNVDYSIRKITPAGIISTIAGAGKGSGTKSIHVRQIAADKFGNVYYADEIAPFVHKISPDGTISVVAGDTTTGISGYTGDGGPAVLAQIHQAVDGICTDDSGNLYIADGGNYVVRKVDTHGIISTFAGNGSYENSGDGGLATAAGMAPRSVFMDHRGYLYLASGSRIRRISLSTGIISTYAGTDTMGYSGDGGPATLAKISVGGVMTIDNNNNVYLANPNSPGGMVRKINSAGIITTVAGTDSIGFSGDGGPAVNAKFDVIQGLAVDPSCNVLYIADMYNSRVRMVLTCTSHITSQPKDTTATVGSKPTFTLGDFGPACYQWQVDTGAGFNDIDTAKFGYWDYRNVHASTLNLPTAALHMNNFKYRCIRYSLTACPDTSSYATLSVIPLSVATVSNTPQINIYPNPVSNQLNISSPVNLSHIQVLDITGKVLLSQAGNSHIMNIDVSSLSPGLYFVRLNDQYVQKVTKSE